MFNRNVRYAYTLAEVLITLGIIGVIAALTIPILINSIEKQSLVSQYKDTYSLLSNAVQKLKVDYGSIDSVASMSAPDADTNFMEAFKTVLKFAKVCDRGAGAGVCFHAGTTNSKNLHGDAWPYNLDAYSSGILVNGAMISLGGGGTTKNCDFTPTVVTSGPLYQATCLFVNIDVNGFSPPNTLGRDIFMLWIAKEGLYPRGSNGDYNYYESNNFCNPSYTHQWSGQSCGAKVLGENAMNY